MITKKCSKCKQEKLMTDFGNSSKTEDGKSIICKQCKSIVDKKYRQNHQERLNAYKRDYNADPKNKTRRNAYTYNRRRTDPLFREILNSRSMLAKAIKRKTIGENSRLESYVCCTYPQLIAYLGPTASNKPQIDHIVPLAQAQTIEEIKALYHYTNLQWSDSDQNHSKFDGWTEIGADLCRKLLNREWDFSKTSYVDLGKEVV